MVTLDNSIQRELQLCNKLGANRSLLSSQLEIDLATSYTNEASNFFTHHASD